MARLPFSVFRRKGRRFFYVQFKCKNGDYLPAVSTRQTTESSAIETAFQWLRDGKPSKISSGAIKPKAPEKGQPFETHSTSENTPLNIAPFNISISMREALRDIKNTAEAEFLCKELKRRGFLKAYAVAGTGQAVDFLSFLRNFWEYDSSPYIKEKLRKNHGIHRNYTIGQKQAVEKFWKPFFEGRCIGEITRQDIDRFMDNLDVLANQSLSEKRKNTKEKTTPLTLSAGRKNIIIKAGTIPLRWAFSKEIIEKDITTGITWFSGKAAERQILTPEIVRAMFMVPWLDARSRLANLLAAVTGLRSGEIRGLKVKDLGQDCLYVRHSWNRRDGLKTTKTNDARTVEVPFPSLINELVFIAKQNPHEVTMDSYVFWAEKTSSKPVEDRLLTNGLRDALVKTGMSEKSASGYVFHGWRHFFTSYMKGKVENKLLKTQTGHKTDIMLNRYGDHMLEGDRERIRQAQQEVFGALIPME